MGLVIAKGKLCGWCFNAEFGASSMDVATIEFRILDPEVLGGHLKALQKATVDDKGQIRYPSCRVQLHIDE